MKYLGGKPIIKAREILEKGLILGVDKRGKLYYWIKRGKLKPINLNPEQEGKPDYWFYLSDIKEINNLIKQGVKNARSKRVFASSMAKKA